eukprot:361095-Chlamydomonas_euryale.AAC.18
MQPCQCMAHLWTSHEWRTACQQQHCTYYLMISWPGPKPFVNYMQLGFVGEDKRIGRMGSSHVR